MKILVTSFFILCAFLPFVALSEYKYTEDSFPKDGVPKGKIIKTGSRIAINISEKI